MTENVWILGIHMTPFGKRADKDVLDLAAEAALAALKDAGVTMRDMQVMGYGNLRGQTSGQSLQKQIGQTGIPSYNVSNACATGSTAMRAVMMSIKSGESDMGIAVGVEKLYGAGLLTGNDVGSGPETWTPKGRNGAIKNLDGYIGTSGMAGLFAQIGMAYNNSDPRADFELFARIAEKSHSHSTLNPNAAYQNKMSLEQIMNDPMIAYPHTRSMCSANCDGAAAAVLVSESKLRTLSLEQQRRAVKISASVLASDPWTESAQEFPDVSTVTRNAAIKAYELAGVGPQDMNLVELHDCFAAAELVHYDNLQLCEPGGAIDFFNSGATWRDGKTPVNVSGGLQSKGHPIAATGIANIWEVATHLRNEAGPRQIEGAKVGMAHVIGLGSSCTVHILEKSSL